MKNVFYAQIVTTNATLSTLSSTEAIAYIKQHLLNVMSFEIFTSTKQLSYKSSVITINTEEYKFIGTTNASELCLVIESNI